MKNMKPEWGGDKAPPSSSRLILLCLLGLFAAHSGWADPPVSDSPPVYTTGDQTIAGTKNFTGTLQVAGVPLSGGGTPSTAAANLVFAGPVSGSAAAPAFRALVAGDLPGVAWSGISGTPTSLAGYGITDPIVLTSGSYTNPGWIVGLDWSKISGTPTSLSGYGITDPVVLTSGSYANPGWVTSLAWSKISGTPTSLSGYAITDAVPNSITVNGHALTGNVTVALNDVLPSQTANSGKVLGTDGTNASWQGFPSLNSLLPSQTGNSGKVLQSDGTNPSWQTAAGGASNYVAQTAWLGPTGDDGTGALGDPGHPFASASAAYGSGAAVLFLEPNGGGSYGTIDTSGSNITLTLVGSGAALASVAIVTEGGNATITGNGAQLVAASISTDGAAGSAGESGNVAPDYFSSPNAGGNGGNAGNITVTGLYAPTVSASGGSGGTGGAGVNGWNGGSAATNGAAGGGNGAGGTVTATDCIIDAVGVNAGNNGPGGGGGNYDCGGNSDFSNAGSGGASGLLSANAGTMTVSRCILTSSFSASAGTDAGGGAGGTTNGAGSNGSAGGSGGGSSSPGSGAAQFSELTPFLSGSYTMTYRGVIEAGAFISTQN